MAHDELIEIVVDVLTDARQLAQVHRRAGDVEDAAVRQGLSVGPGVLVSEDLNLLVEHRTRGKAVEVEVSVVGEVADRISIRDGLVADGELIVVRQRVEHMDRHIARVAALAISCMVSELHTLIRLLCRPELLVEALEAAVDVILVVRARVEIELIRLAVNRHLAASDAVGMAADEAAHARIVLLVGSAICVAEHDIRALVVLPIGAPCHKSRTVRRDLDFRSLCIAQRVELYLSAIAQFAKRFLFDCSHEAFLPK